MAFASRSSLRAPTRRTSSFSGRRFARNALLGLAATTFALAAVGTVVFGIGRAMTSTFEPRPNLRSAGVFADASNWQPWTVPSHVGMASQRAIIASLKLPPTRQPVLAANPPVAAFALASATSHEVKLPDPDVTGSLGDRTPRLAFADPVPDAPAKTALPRADVLRLPLPRPQTQLAALTPPDVSTRPEPDARMRRTAIYDISAKTVYLPNGERLEAHSGVGPLMDNPLYVHLKMRGPTPPNIYRLTMRERLFHGVQAIRMTPEDEKAMLGRDGILAHSYLLGPSGQSHGCVSFKDYPRFLRAFLRGEVDRMIVVRKLDKPPTSFAQRDLDRLSALSTRPDKSEVGLAPQTVPVGNRLF